MSTGVLVTDVEKSYGASRGDYNSDGFPDLFVVNSDHENNNPYEGSGGSKMNEPEFPNAHTFDEERKGAWPEEVINVY